MLHGKAPVSVQDVHTHKSGDRPDVCGYSAAVGRRSSKLILITVAVADKSFIHTTARFVLTLCAAVSCSLYPSL